MSRSILLHIGAPKAGSTFLQRALAQNRDRLAAAGISYPAGEGNHPGNARGIGAMADDGFAAWFTAADRVVLSHEDLFALEQEAVPLAAWCRRNRVTLQKLVFLRPWSDFCFGDYSQHMKQHFDRYLASRNPFDGLSFAEMAARRAARVDPAEFFLRWARVVPQPPLVLAPHHAIPATVERLLGLGGLDWEVPRHLTNPSLRIADVEALAEMMRDPAVAEDEIRAEYRAAHHRTADPDPGRSAERVAMVERLFAPHNRAVLDIWGYDNRA
jgi:hypothetical protein